MYKKVFLYMSMVFIIMYGFVQDRYDYFIFGFITLSWIAIDLELIERMDSFFMLKVRSNASRLILAFLLLIAVLGVFNIPQMFNVTLQSMGLVLYGLSITIYVSSVLCFYITYK
ncbi:hypothetical protein IMX26_06345 [Clostridium sp. 'deep sea']|uniref:hypothetical protein n=1 Tax=Clostridium sp. 'deep sea' TaxID=2779445 RepID=UPI0018964679|nr:hypothetical protein [Clostridium sp. 'deep sea']QOR36426.1 hypothetical protein IMX26_06345 [Clostridium sp. 'deep sea']